MIDDKNKKNSPGRGFGEQLFDMVTDSIDAMDFSDLSEKIRDTVNETRDEISRQLDSLQKGYYRGSSGRQNTRAARQIREPHPFNGRYGTKPGTEIIIRPGNLPGTYSGPIQMALGGTGFVVFGGISLGFGLAGAAFGLSGSALTAATIVIESIFLPLTVVSAFFLARGIFTRNRVRRMRDYFSRWKDKSFIMLSELQEQSGQSLKQIKQDIHYLIDKRLLPGARMDQEQTCLLLTDEAIQQYEAAKEAQRIREEEERRKRQEEEQWASATGAKKEMYSFTKQAESSLTALEEYQKKISSDSMKQKLEGLKLLLTRIFVCVKEHPEKLRLTSRLMNYYLPSVLKLLSVYEDMEKQPIQGGNIQKTLEEIEASLDTINDALETMFDELFQEEALDISADIQVLRTMLVRDGWMASPDKTF